MTSVLELLLCDTVLLQLEPQTLPWSCLKDLALALKLLKCHAIVRGLQPAILADLIELMAYLACCISTADVPVSQRCRAACLTSKRYTRAHLSR